MIEQAVMPHRPDPKPGEPLVNAPEVAVIPHRQEPKTAETPPQETPKTEEVAKE